MHRRTVLGSLGGVVGGAVLAAAGSPLRAQPAIEAPAGRYMLDPTHASLLWRISHYGLSNYTARFTRFTGHVDFNPTDLSRCSALATVDTASVETDYPTGFQNRDWNGDLRGEPFFNVTKFREATWRSISVQVVEGQRLRIPGELSLLGITAPVTLDATLNATFKVRPVTKLPTIGFSARGTLDRRMFGMNTPKPGGGVATSVEIIIEAEFILPA